MLRLLSPASALNICHEAWRQVIGPVAAAVASLHHIGWTVLPRISWWADRDGVEIDVFELSPRYVASLVERDAMRQLWADAAGRHWLYSQAADRPLTRPLKYLLGSKAKSTDE